MVTAVGADSGARAARLNGDEGSPSGMDNGERRFSPSPSPPSPLEALSVKGTGANWRAGNAGASLRRTWAYEMRFQTMHSASTLVSMYAANTWFSSCATVFCETTTEGYCWVLARRWWLAWA